MIEQCQLIRVGAHQRTLQDTPLNNEHPSTHYQLTKWPVACKVRQTVSPEVQNAEELSVVALEVRTPVFLSCVSDGDTVMHNYPSSLMAVPHRFTYQCDGRKL